MVNPSDMAGNAEEEVDYLHTGNVPSFIKYMDPCRPTMNEVQY